MILRNAAGSNGQTKYLSVPNEILKETIEYEIFGEGSQISTNQRRENSAFSLLIG